MTYNNIKSHKKKQSVTLSPLSRRYIFRKTIGGVRLTKSTPLTRVEILFRVLLGIGAPFRVGTLYNSASLRTTS